MSPLAATNPGSTESAAAKAGMRIVPTIRSSTPSPFASIMPMESVAEWRITRMPSAPQGRSQYPRAASEAGPSRPADAAVKGVSPRGTSALGSESGNEALESANPDALETPPELVTLSCAAPAFPAQAPAAIVVGRFTITVPPPGKNALTGAGPPEKTPPALLASGLERPVEQDRLRSTNRAPSWNAVEPAEPEGADQVDGRGSTGPAAGRGQDRGSHLGDAPSAGILHDVDREEDAPVAAAGTVTVRSTEAMLPAGTAIRPLDGETPSANAPPLVADHEASTPPSLARIGSVSDATRPARSPRRAAPSRAAAIQSTARAGRGAAPDETMPARTASPRMKRGPALGAGPWYSDDGSRNCPWVHAIT